MKETIDLPSEICREFGNEIERIRKCVDVHGVCTHVDMLVEKRFRTKNPVDWMNITEIIINKYKEHYLNNLEALYVAIEVKDNKDWKTRICWNREDVIKNMTYSPATFAIFKNLYKDLCGITLRPIYIEGISEESWERCICFAAKFGYGDKGERRKYVKIILILVGKLGGIPRL